MIRTCTMMSNNDLTRYKQNDFENEGENFKSIEDFQSPKQF